MRKRSGERPRSGHVCVPLFAFAVLLATSVAQQPAQGGVQGPDSGTSLTDAHLSKVLKQKIERDLDWQDMDKESRADTTRLSSVYDLSLPAADGHPPRHVLRVSGGGPPCGRGGNCPELLYDAGSGTRLLKSGGFNLVFLKTKHAGMPDLQIDDSIGPDELFHTVYRFNGSVYKQFQHVKYCCSD